MFARTSTWTGSAEALGKWEQHVKSKVSAFVQAQPGNAGGTFFVDREAGTALTLTFWESEEAAAATDKFADQSRASTVEATASNSSSEAHTRSSCASSCGSRANFAATAVNISA